MDYCEHQRTYKLFLKLARLHDRQRVTIMVILAMFVV